MSRSIAVPRRVKPVRSREALMRRFARDYAMLVYGPEWETVVLTVAVLGDDDSGSGIDTLTVQQAGWDGTVALRTISGDVQHTSLGKSK